MSTATVQVESWSDPITGEVRSVLSDQLQAFLLTRRWYREKAKRIRAVRVEDVITVEQRRFYLIPIAVEDQEGEVQTYLFGIGIDKSDETESEDESQRISLLRLRLADGEERTLSDGFSHPDFRRAILSAIETGQSFRGAESEFAACRTEAFSRVAGEPALALESKLSRAEQSNTSIVYGDKLILKVFRKLEPGLNPDVEMGTYLTNRGFKNTPALAGQINYVRPQKDPACAAILQQFVPNRGDAWSYTLDTLSLFYKTYATDRFDLPKLESHHPLELSQRDALGVEHRLIGNYLASARLLGVRTAEMHAALTDMNAGPEFVPELVTFENRKELYESALAQTNLTYGLLRDHQSALTGVPAFQAAKIIEKETDVRERLRPLLDSHVEAYRIRHHGDYHLGQVLYTGGDFMIIDFEGEPAVPLEERRRKQLVMRDVAGMLRSFQYAAFAALFDHAERTACSEEQLASFEPLASFWTACTGAEYLRGYFDRADGKPFVSPTYSERRRLLDVFLLQKALYEVAYELNNRPSWVRIPLQGILTLV
jgi:maltose alpha-D-glucosyltransferase/alpha-amylase